MAKRRPPPRDEGKPPPRCKAILLCDQAIIEAVTGKISVIGIFDGFGLPRVPGFTKPFTAFLQLVEGFGRYEITVEIHDLRQNHVLARATTPGVEFSERLAKINLMLPIPPLPLQHAGSYDLVVFANSQEIDRQKFLATTPRKPKNDPDKPPPA